jgi:Tol biopolymer transport system component
VGYFSRLAEDRTGREPDQHARDRGGKSTWSPDGRYLAYIVKPKTSSVFEIDVYDTLMRDVKHLTTGTAKDRMNVAPIWSADGKFIVYTQEQSKGTDSNVFRGRRCQRAKYAADAA